METNKSWSIDDKRLNFQFGTQIAWEVRSGKLGRMLKPIVLVLDNGPIHTSKATLAALAARAHWLTVEWLPKYAPELNDIEGLWRDLKRHHLAHQTFAGPDDLDQAIHDAVRKLNTERSHHPLADHRTAS